jgi:hypothetical protein
MRTQGNAPPVFPQEVLYFGSRPTKRTSLALSARCASLPEIKPTGDQCCVIQAAFTAKSFQAAFNDWDKFYFTAFGPAVHSVEGEEVLAGIPKV